MARPLIIPFFIPHAGCPFTCVFCNQWEISGAAAPTKPEDIRPQVLKYLAAHKKEAAWAEVAFFGGSFTGLEQELQKSLLQAAYALKQEGIIQGIRLSTRPDYINKEIVENLYAHGVTTVELGVQSLAEDVLAQSCRGHSPADVVKAVKIIRDYPLELILQLMLGLPGDSREKAMLTAEKAISLKPDGVRIYPTLVMKNTTLADWYQQGLYRPWSLDEAVEVGAQWLAKFSAAGIRVIRLGLQAADNISPEEDLLAGPYHPAYGELVQSRLLLEQLRSMLDSLENPGSKITIFCNPRDISKVRGQKGSNLRMLKADYNIAEIVLQTDPSLARDELKAAAASGTTTMTRQEFLEKYRIK